MPDMITIDALMAAMQEYADAVGEEREARKGYEGHSWDWFGRSYFDQIDEAKNKAQTLMDGYVKAAARIALAEHGIVENKT